MTRKEVLKLYLSFSSQRNQLLFKKTKVRKRLTSKDEMRRKIVRRVKSEESNDKRREGKEWMIKETDSGEGKFPDF